jgi:hypothetical protein
VLELLRVLDELGRTRGWRARKVFEMRGRRWASSGTRRALAERGDRNLGSMGVGGVRGKVDGREGDFDGRRGELSLEALATDGLSRLGGIASAEIGRGKHGLGQRDRRRTARDGDRWRRVEE